MRYYCYVHAIEAGLLGQSWTLLTAVAANTGYSTNAVALVLEALSQYGCITEANGRPPYWSITLPPKTPEQFCTSVRLWASKRFDGHTEHLVLNHWHLVRGKDIGLILSRLVESGILGLGEEHNGRVLVRLRTLRRQLLTFA
jgi:uncharacterized repeat protein (TIGR04138 family)